MSSAYYVSHSGHQMGPYTVVEIVSLIKAGKLSPLDYIFDESSNDWILFLEHKELKAEVKSLKPSVAPKPHVKKIPGIAQQSGSGPSGNENPQVLGSKNQGEKSGLPRELAKFAHQEWYALKGENKFGPFSYTDVVKLLQQSVIYEFDFVWHPGLEGWKRIAELEAFSKDNIKLLKETSLPEVSQVFFRRRHKRVKYGGTILVHDNRHVWKGQAVEIGEGGAGVLMENSLVLPGQQLFLHFKPGDGVPPFNAVCEVVSKQYLNTAKTPNSSVKYGLKFKAISSEAESVIKEYTKKPGNIAA